jgi:hypothetical protein
VSLAREVPAFERHRNHLERDLRIEVDTAKTGTACK